MRGGAKEGCVGWGRLCVSGDPVAEVVCLGVPWGACTKPLGHSRACALCKGVSDRTRVITHPQAARGCHKAAKLCRILSVGANGCTCAGLRLKQRQGPPAAGSESVDSSSPPATAAGWRRTAPLLLRAVLSCAALRCASSTT